MIAWGAVVVFIAIPLVFCVMYSLRFSQSMAWMWLKEVLVDLLMGWLGINFISLFVELLASFAYVKLYPLLQKKIATRVMPASPKEHVNNHQEYGQQGC